MSNWNQQVMFPEEFIALQKELLHHTELCSRLGLLLASDIELKFAEIATYCDVMLDGDYNERDFIRLAKIFTQKLECKRIAPSIQIIRGV